MTAIALRKPQRRHASLIPNFEVDIGVGEELERFQRVHVDREVRTSETLVRWSGQEVLAPREQMLRRAPAARSL